jgi:hypothetical protein
MAKSLLSGENAKAVATSRLMVGMKRKKSSLRFNTHAHANRPLGIIQTRTIPSWCPEASHRPLGEKAKQVTSPENNLRDFPSLTPHNINSPFLARFQLPEANH